jgi:membrane fusion protein, heavy metal efflux system
MPSMTHIRAVTLATFALTLLQGCQRNVEEAASGGEPAGGAITLWTDSTELFMEHPALIVGQPDKFAVHLTDLTDFAPLRSGRITLTFTPRDGGPPLVVVQDSPRAPGIYGPAPRFERAGLYDLSLQVESPQARDLIQVPNLRVYARAAEAPRESGAEEDGIAFLKEQQWKTNGFRTAFATQGEVEQSFQATGVIVPAAGRFAQVAAPISGLVATSGVAASPAPGQRVRPGAVLAVLSPAVGEAGGSAYALARRELREANDEYERAKRLAAVEAIPARRLHEAEIRLQAAREAIAGLPGADGMSDNGRLAVRAPIGGVISERSIVPGSRVEAGQMLFTIVDPSVVWLRVNVPAAQAASIGRDASASFMLPGSDRTFQTTRTVSIGSVVDPSTRTVPAIYEARNADGAIRVGSNVTAFLRTGRRAQGVVIPSSAVLEEDGRPIAYVQPEGEKFERRELTLGGASGDFTLVLSGIEAGERVVSGAAYQVRLASLSTAVPAHGHEH